MEVLVPGSPGAGRALYVDLDHPLVWRIDGALSAARCTALLAWAGGLDFGVAPITTARGPVMNTDIRNNDRAMVDAPVLADALYAIIQPTLPTRMFDGWTPCGLNERLRIYRYTPGQAFRLHRDGYFERSPHERSMLTAMFYLDEGCEGGETCFPSYRVSVTPRRGTALLFQHAILHEGAQVVGGTKTVLRSDVMYRRG